jgi:hypothetical protein
MATRPSRDDRGGPDEPSDLQVGTSPRVVGLPFEVSVRADSIDRVAAVMGLS